LDDVRAIPAWGNVIDRAACSFLVRAETDLEACSDIQQKLKRRSCWGPSRRPTTPFCLDEATPSLISLRTALISINGESPRAWEHDRGTSNLLSERKLDAISTAAFAADLKNMAEAHIRAPQGRLRDAQSYTGAIDGKPSAATSEAIRRCPVMAPML
jgi:hypothetical protein